MDVLRKELDAFYKSQNLVIGRLDYSILAGLRKQVEIASRVSGECMVITDAAADYCYIFGGCFSYLIGLDDSQDYYKQMESSDEDVIYNRIHPEDLVDKRMLEYEFFKFIDSQPDSKKIQYKATCHLRIKDRHGQYIHADNSTRVIGLSPEGKVWLILCCYNLSPVQKAHGTIEARIVDCITGEISEPGLAERRAHILTVREKEILILIKEGKPSKQIADKLKISINTVNRHRQNIL